MPVKVDFPAWSFEYEKACVQIVTLYLSSLCKNIFRGACKNWISGMVMKRSYEGMHFYDSDSWYMYKFMHILRRFLSVHCIFSQTQKNMDENYHWCNTTFIIDS